MMRKIKPYVLIVIFLLMLLVYIPAESGNMTIASAAFYNANEYENLSFWINSNYWHEEPIKKTINNVECLELGKNINSYYLLVDVEDDYITKNDQNVEITIEYFDTGNSMFTIQYNSKNNVAKQADIVYMQDENKWKKYTFVLSDAAFQDALNLCDFWIGVYIPSKGTFSKDNVFIKSIEVNKSKSINTDYSYAELGNNTLFKKINAVVYGNYGEYDALGEENKYDDFWTLNSNKDKRYILFDVADDYISINDNNINITISYLDKGYGDFAVQYNSSVIEYSINTDKKGNMYLLGEDIEIILNAERKALNQTEVVTMNNSGEWLEHTFFINDAAFNNNINGGDFRICTNIESENGMSDSEVYIESVKVIKSNIQGTQLSNVIPIEFSIFDISSGDKLYEEQFEGSLNEDKIVISEAFTVSYNGMFRIDINITDSKSQKVTSESALFSGMAYNNSINTINDIFGVNTHMGKGWFDSDYSENFISITKNAGIGWIRDEMEWSKAETIKGNVEILPEWGNYIDLAVEAGIEPLIILDYGNAFYDQGGFPYTDEGINAFLNYVRTVVKHFNGRVNYFEIWNEFNLEGSLFNPTSKTPYDYSKVLKLVYDEIKSINPEATVIAGAMAGTDPEWLKELIDAGSIDYMDVVSIHPYCYPNSPEEGNVIDNVKDISNLLKQYNKEIPVWISEIGWSTYSGKFGINEDDTAAFLVRVYIEGIVNGIDKIFWYNLHDKGNNPEYIEHHFGLINNIYDETTPMSAKAPYLAYNTLTAMVSSATYIEDISEGNVKAYQFRDYNSNKDVIILWSEDKVETDVTILNINDSVEKYSLYSNEMEIYTNQNTARIKVSDHPIYIVYNTSNETPFIDVSHIS